MIHITNVFKTTPEIIDIEEALIIEKLIELIKEKGKKPADIYKKAEIDKALFSKIKSDKNYHPSKETALAFAIALHLSLEETQDLIGRAGYALSSSLKRDLIVRCYIESKNYNVNDLNGKLIDYGFDPLTNKCGLCIKSLKGCPSGNLFVFFSFYN